MSLTVSGIIAIISKPERIELKGGKSVLYKFDAVSADRHTAGKRHKYKVSVIISAKDEEKALSRLVKNKVLQIHSGRWNAEEKDFGDRKIIYNNLYVSWSEIDPLEWASKKETKEEGEKNGQPN
jgi:hypothetical protein